jgi:hypothetical protein
MFASFKSYGLDSKNERLLTVQEDMIQRASKIFALYFDAIEGFEQLASASSELKAKLTEEISSSHGLAVSPSTLQKIESLPGTDPSTLGLIPGMFSLSLKDCISRRLKSKKNHDAIGNYLLIMLYQYWEDLWRGQISKAFGSKEKKFIKSDFWGYLRVIRICLIHKKEIADKSVQDDFPEMKWFRAGEEIVIDRAKVRPVLKKKVIFELCFLELW